MIKPDYKIKIKGEVFPVFRTPVSDDQLHNLLLEGKTNKFYVHDMKTNKLKVYDFNNKLPMRQDLNIDLSYGTISKLFFVGILSFYSYRMLKWKPLKTSKEKNKEFLDNLYKKYPKKETAKSPEKKDNVSSSPNGWIIEEMN